MFKKERQSKDNYDEMMNRVQDDNSYLTGHHALWAQNDLYRHHEEQSDVMICLIQTHSTSASQSNNN